jgi:hypothetical protein
MVESGVLFNIDFNVNDKDACSSSARVNSKPDLLEEIEGLQFSVSDDVRRWIPYGICPYDLSDVGSERREEIRLTKTGCRMEGRDDPDARSIRARLSGSDA